jgi:hypothetical protein
VKKKLIVLVCFIIFSAVVIFPPIAYHYIYPNLGDDFATNVNYIAHLNLWMLTYYAYVYIGYPMRWIHALTGISYTQLYFWFSYIVLLGVGYCWYFVLSKLVDYKAGLLALVLPFICSIGLISQFGFGGVFDMISVGIILPFLIYFFIKWFQERKKHQLILSLVLAFIFGNFHFNGIFLSPIVAVCLVLYYVYSLYKKSHIDQKLVYLLLSFITIGIIDQYAIVDPTRLANGIYKIYHYNVANSATLYLYYASIVLVIISFLILSIYYIKRKSLTIRNIIVFLVIVGINLMFAFLIFRKEAVDMVFTNVVSPLSANSAGILPLAFTIDIINPFILILLVVATCMVLGKPNKNKSLLFVLGVIIVILLGLVLIPLASSRDRILYDVSTIIAVTTAVLVAISWKSNVIKVALVIVVILGMYDILPQWFSYKSAVTQVDKEAFNYLNTLNDTTYTTSSQVQPLIYNLYIKEQYEQDSSELLITRNIAMTNNSDITSGAYIPHGIKGTDGFTLVKTFTDGGITVSIYKGGK